MVVGAHTWKKSIKFCHKSEKTGIATIHDKSVCILNIPIFYASLAEICGKHLKAPISCDFECNMTEIFLE